MHINMKYYIVSIGAIFISLGIGILVGYNLNYDQELSKQQASVISDLDNKFDALKVTNDNLEKSLADLSDDYDKAIAFINDNVNNLVVGRLTDKNIGIISTNQDNDYTKEINEIITTANGNVAFDITLNNNIFNEKKIEALATKLNLEIKDTKDIIVYIEEALSESNASLKLKELEDAEMIKINSLNENYQSYDFVVIAGGNNGKLGKEQYENIDKILIETLKDKDKNSDIFNAPITVMDINEEEGILEVIIHAIGAKTKPIINNDKVYVKSPYYNGIFGLKEIKSNKEDNCLIVINGLSQANVINVIRRLLRNNNNVEVFVNGTLLDIIKEKIESMNVKINYFNIEKDKQLLFNYIKDKKISFVYCAASVEFSRQIMNILNSVDKNIKLSISNNNLICCGEGICGACIVDLNGKKVKTCKAQIDSREYLTHIK